MDNKDLLGCTVTDNITGFTGVVTGQVRYITGCNQVLVQPRLPDTADKHDMPTSSWIDEQRLTVLDSIDRVVLNNGPTPGFDKPAPRI